MSKQSPQLLRCKTRVYSDLPYCETTFYNIRKKTSLRLKCCNPPSTTSSPEDKYTTEASSCLYLLDISSFWTVFMALSVAITEILRALCILKKGWEDIKVKWKAYSEKMLLLVNKSEQVNHVCLLPMSSVPQGSKLSATGLAQAPGQNTDKGTGDF